MNKKLYHGSKSGECYLLGAVGPKYGIVKAVYGAK